MRKLTAEENNQVYQNSMAILKAFTDNISILSGQKCIYDVFYNGDCAIFLDGERCFYGNAMETIAWLNEKVESYYEGRC